MSEDVDYKFNNSTGASRPSRPSRPWFKLPEIRR
jgi:hypothetical protein